MHGSDDLGWIMRRGGRADFIGKTLCAGKHACTTDDWHALVAVHFPQAIDELPDAWCVTRSCGKDNHCIWLALRNLLHDFILCNATGGEQHFISRRLKQVGAELTRRVFRLFRSANTEQSSTIALRLAVLRLGLIHQHSKNPRCISIGKRSQLILPPHSEDHLHRWPVEALRDLARRESGVFELSVQLADTSSVAAHAELKESFGDKVDVGSLTHGA